MLLIFSPINTFLCSLPWLVKTPRSILADKYFLSNYVGIQSTFFSISNILKQWKVWEDLFTNKKIKAPSVHDGVEVGRDERIKWNTVYWTWASFKTGMPPSAIKENQRHLTFSRFQRWIPKSRSHTLESKDPSSSQTSTYFPKDLLDSSGKLKICHRKQTNKTQYQSHNQTKTHAMKWRRSSTWASE